MILIRTTIGAVTLNSCIECPLSSYVSTGGKIKACEGCSNLERNAVVYPTCGAEIEMPLITEACIFCGSKIIGVKFLYIGKDARVRYHTETGRL